MGKTASSQPYGVELVAAHATQLGVLTAKLEGARCPREKRSSGQRRETNQSKSRALGETSERRLEERRRVHVDGDRAHKHGWFRLEKNATDCERKTCTTARASTSQSTEFPGVESGVREAVVGGDNHKRARLTARRAEMKRHRKRRTKNERRGRARAS